MWRSELSTLTLKNREVSSDSEEASLSLPAAVWQIAWPIWWPQVCRIAFLLLTDMLALLLAVSLGYLLWAGLVLDQSPSVYIDLFRLLLLFPMGYAVAGMYPGFGLGAVETLRRISCCTSFGFLVLAAASFALKLPPDYSRMSFAIGWGISLVLVPVLRVLLLTVVNRLQWWGEPTLLIGSGQWIQRTIRVLKNALWLGYRPLWVLSPDTRWHGHVVEGVAVLGGPELAPHLAKRGIRVALVKDDKLSSNGATLSWFQQHFRHVVMIQESQDLPVERVRVCNLGGLFGIEFTNNLLRTRNRVVKRALDLILGGIILVLSLPLMALGGLLVKLLSHGPFFFCQEREGLGGCPIKVWKLRTMYQDAERRLETFLSINPELRREWERRFKLTRDPRIIPVVGPFLRRFSVDELPQLWSVVQGEMSLVGPRPFPEYHLQQLPPEFRELRRRVRPGLTGMWQVTVRSNGSIEEQIIHDTYYIRNWSLWVDLYILARTVFVVLAGRGAY
jgi:Undecaprenyl-phosphate galactose phosphotransferase WbaP